MPALYWACSEGKRTRTPHTDAAVVSPGTSQHTPARPWPAAHWLDTQTHKVLSDTLEAEYDLYNVKALQMTSCDEAKILLKMYILTVHIFMQDSSGH